MKSLRAGDALKEPSLQILSAPQGVAEGAAPGAGALALLTRDPNRPAETPARGLGAPRGPSEAWRADRPELPPEWQRRG
eukprot:CAMPEP_0170276070 /NCGR_PEP_ID=MMETSP0116_2-20130129/38020_1 /TAXON_ID=400756 /ORGANISM="Durinskia baltica, Strain CSIRO CS-38" /LENGTH=78 /DNA_ID=CAMNT_0010527343 /DNA_START=65 /DNA_END=299 /DNA_ORIENTATION=-